MIENEMFLLVRIEEIEWAEDAEGLPHSAGMVIQPTHMRIEDMGEDDIDNAVHAMMQRMGQENDNEIVSCRGGATILSEDEARELESQVRDMGSGARLRGGMDSPLDPEPN